jgi:hypothetical protein
MARVWREGSSEDLCPGCGGSLQPVSDLSELIGLRALRTRPRGRRTSTPERFVQVSERIREQIARHDAELRWRIDG